MLTQVEAEALVVARLNARFAAVEISIAARGEAERSFGWVFEISVGGIDSEATSAPALPRRVIVNKHSRQVVASSTDYDVEQFVRLYEKLLAQNQARSQGWCGTLPLPFPWTLWRKRTVAERAKEGGFYEIRDQEGSHE